MNNMGGQMLYVKENNSKMRKANFVKDDECWKVIKNFPDYEISNYGYVRKIKKHKNIKSNINGRGYTQVRLTNNGGRKTLYVHRLVAQTFLNNYNNYKEVNHKDENKQNNCAENLEWCNHLYNCNYGTKIKRQAMKMLNREDTSKKILQYDLQGNFIKEFLSMHEANRETGVCISNIHKCCNQLRNKAGNYIWKYVEDVKNG